MEKQSPLQGFSHLLKVSPPYHDWLKSLNQEKGLLFELHRRKRGYDVIWYIS